MSSRAKKNSVNYMRYSPTPSTLTKKITSRAIEEFENGDRTGSAENMTADLAALYL